MELFSCTGEREILLANTVVAHLWEIAKIMRFCFLQTGGDSANDWGTQWGESRMKGMTRKYVVSSTFWGKNCTK